ncbi:MAG: HAMP domain-containing protein [Dehalococcoidia bacterium]|nr:MAG: HAMP domain-containing protein [Dehalococcoidia bacterium]
MPIRWRLTLWFSVILCVALVLAGVIIYIVLQNHLHSEVDDNLKVYAAEIKDYIGSDIVMAPDDYDVVCDAACACSPALREFGSPGVHVRLIDGNGNIVGRSENLGDLELPVEESLIERGLAGEAGTATLTASDGTKIRVMTDQIQGQHEPLILEVGQSLRHIDAAMNQVRWALIGSLLAALAFAIVSGGILVRRALAPVVDIARTAQNIEESSDLSKRVGYDGPKDEIGQLATTFDHMIEHLEKAFESQRLFIADASHDLRSPLTVLQGNLDLLKRDLGEEERRESLRAIEAETHRMSRIVDDLLLLAEVESGQIEWRGRVSLREVLLESAERGQQLAGDRKVVVGRQEDIFIRGDAHRLKRLLGNLVDNAIRYTPEGGTITLSLFRNEDWACINVVDEGMGIAPEHLPHVFERFYMVDRARSRSHGGSGLGLTIVKAIAEQHGGKVTVTSELGKGSTFTVWLKL